MRIVAAADAATQRRRDQQPPPLPPPAAAAAAWPNQSIAPCLADSPQKRHPWQAPSYGTPQAAMAPKGGKPGGGKVVTDARFAAVHSDPRFQRFPKAKAKVEIDERFAGAC